MYKKRRKEISIKLRRYIEKKYRPSIHMLQFLQNISHVEQPGSLTQTYFYQYDKSKKYQYSKLLNHISIILNSFFWYFLWIN